MREKTKNIYVLTSKNGKKEFVIGAFSSLIKVKECVRGLFKEKQYKTYSLPLNKKIIGGKNKADQMERYCCHYFGTYNEHYIEINDKTNKIKKEGDREVLFWPI